MGFILGALGSLRRFPVAEGQNQVWVLESCFSGTVTVELEERDGAGRPGWRPGRVGLKVVWGQWTKGQMTRAFLKGEVGGPEKETGMGNVQVAWAWTQVGGADLRWQDVRVSGC